MIIVSVCDNNHAKPLNKKHPERMSKIKPFIDQYECKEINFPSRPKKLEKA